MANSFGNKKTKGFNLLDFLLIVLLLVLLVVGIVSVAQSNPNNISGGDKNVTFVIETAVLPEKAGTQIKIADRIYDDVSGQLLGTVTNVETHPYSLVGHDADGKPVLTEIEGKVTVVITVSTTVWADGSSYSIDGYGIAIGKEISFHSERLAASGTCVLING